MSKKKKRPSPHKKDSSIGKAKPIYNPDVLKDSFAIGSFGTSLPSSITSSLASSLSGITLPIDKKDTKLSKKIFDTKKEKRGPK